jgi:RNA polymerase sigma-70 factor (ECF subfamily)
MMSPNFEDYLDALAEKDEQAFAYVYEQTKRGVYSVIVSIVRDRHTTEDLMQDTYMKMLQNLHSYQRGRNFAAWLFEIAKNLAYDHLRKNKPVIPTDPQEQSYVFDHPQETSPKTEYTMEELMAPLDALERQIVLLRVVSETKFKDIALTVDKPLGTVLWIYNKALAKMKKSIGKE